MPHRVQFLISKQGMDLSCFSQPVVSGCNADLSAGGQNLASGNFDVCVMIVAGDVVFRDGRRSKTCQAALIYEDDA